MSPVPSSGAGATPVHNFPNSEHFAATVFVPLDRIPLDRCHAIVIVANEMIADSGCDFRQSTMETRCTNAAPGLQLLARILNEASVPGVARSSLDYKRDSNRYQQNCPENQCVIRGRSHPTTSCTGQLDDRWRRRWISSWGRSHRRCRRLGSGYLQRQRK